MRSIRKALFDSYVRKHLRAVEYIAWADVKAVVLLAHSSTISHDKLLDIVGMLRREQKTVLAYYFVDNKQADIATDNSAVRIVTRKDANWLQRPKAGVVPDAVNADIVVDLSFADLLFNAYLATVFRPKLICGATGVNRYMGYDFQISIPESDNKPAYLIAQIVKYLKMIQSEK